MIKSLFVVLMVVMTLGFEAQAQYNNGRNNRRPGHVYPNYPRPNYPPVYPSYPNYPNYPSYPNYPVYPQYPTYPNYPVQNVVTCYAIGLANGVSYYGIANNVFQASQNAMSLCQSWGQLCQATGCR